MTVTVAPETAARVRDDHLRFALSFHPLFIGGDPFRVTSMYILVSHLEKAFGVHYAQGGVQAIADAMADVIRAQGGTLRQQAEVDEILVDQGRAAGVRLTEDVMPGVVQLATGAWYDPQDPGEEKPLCSEATEDCYTWWSNRGQAWAKNVGWRIDYQIATPALAALAREAVVGKAPTYAERWSDHAPLTVTPAGAGIDVT